MWKVVGASVVGTSHQGSATPCQDYLEFLRCELGGNPVLVVAIADGAGSAPLSHFGAEEVVKALLKEVSSAKVSIEEVKLETIQSWFRNALLRLQERAAHAKLEIKDMDCTAMLAILGEQSGVFAQIGDGAWVGGANGTLEALTWPYKGEFANETKFLTSRDAFDAIQFYRNEQPLTEVAGFTDGIESLALNIAAKTVHAPFFTRMFGELALCDDETSLLPPLIGFLSSDRVNGRTDDDKTLVLARRVATQEISDELA